MIALPILLVLVSLIGIRFSRFHTDYLGVSQTTSIKGIFAVIIIMSHMFGYINFPIDGATEVYRTVINYIGQLMVTMFFFYSGYGIVVSYQKKSDYYSSFLKNRLFKLLVHFDLAVLLFAILNFALSIPYPAKEYVTSLIAWGSIGNSNWFIFDTLVFYIITFVAMTIKENTKTGMKIFAAMVSVLCLFVWAFLFISGKGDYWYNTILCFPAGIWFGVLKDRIDSLAKKWYLYWPALAVLCAAFLVLYKRRFFVEYYTLLAPVFCLLIVWVTMKIKLDNPILRWLGKHSFSIYIIQRIPMIIISRYGFNTNSYVYTALVTVSALLLGWLFSLLLSLLDRLFFKKKKA